MSWSDYHRWQSDTLRKLAEPKPRYIARIVMRDGVPCWLIGTSATRDARNAEHFPTIDAARAAMHEYTRGLPLWSYAADIFDVDSERPINEGE